MGNCRSTCGRPRIFIRAAWILALCLALPGVCLAASGSEVPGWLAALANPWISSLFLAIAFVAVVVEIFTPTYGIAAIVAIISFILYFAGNLAEGYATPITILLFIGGAILLFVEATVPGFGIPGITGFALLILGIVFSAESPGTGLISFLGSAAIAATIGAALVKLGYKSNLMQRTVLNAALTKEKGYVGKKAEESLVGKTALTKTILRPTGEIEVDGTVYEVLTQGEFIEKGVEVVVFKAENGQLFVRRK